MVAENNEPKPDDYDGWTGEERIQIWLGKIEVARLESESRLKMFDSVVTFAGIALKGIVLLNGAAAIALLALFKDLVGASSLAAGVSTDRLAAGLEDFALGAFFGVVASALAYLTQRAYSDLPNRLWVGHALNVLTVVVAGAGLVLFVFGLYAAADGLRV